MRKNLLKVPPEVIRRISTFGQDDVVVACVRAVTLADAPRYSNVGVTTVGGSLSLSRRFLPKPSAGRCSTENVVGREVKRTDLPKVSKTIVGEAPDWHGSGTHPTMRTIKVYPVDFYPPKGVEMSATQVGTKGDVWLVKFAVEQVINRRTPNFQKELLFNLNLLQENVGAVDVFPSDTSLADFAASVQVDWEILPKGTVEDVMARLEKRGVSLDPKEREVLMQRLTVLRSLSQTFIIGISGFSGYVGAQIRDDLVAFENVRYGNAIYVMFEDWQEVSKRSRLDLLAGPRDKFERIVHRAGWEKLLRATINHFLYKMG